MAEANTGDGHQEQRNHPTRNEDSLATKSDAYQGECQEFCEPNGIRANPSLEQPNSEERRSDYLDSRAVSPTPSTHRPDRTRPSQGSSPPTMGRQGSAALVSPVPATDHPAYQLPEQQRQSGPESSGYDSEANQADYYALLRTCQIKPDYGRPETPVEVTICISSRLPRCIGRRGAIVKWISQDPNVETKDTTFDPSVSLPPNPYTVYVNTPG
jgi:hypothetical protein